MSRFLVFMVGVLVASTAVAQETADLARGTVDPYSIADQRAKFLRAAGVDSELDEAEFKADGEKGNGFVNKFDTWDQVSLFDKNSSKTLDWFEADEYRKDLRARILKGFDGDNDRRLRNDERTAANDALAKGTFEKATRQAASSERRPDRPSGDNPPRRGPEGDNPPRRGPGNAGPGGAPFGQGGPGGADFQALQAEMLEKYDANKDGELTGEERDRARDEIRERMRAQFVERADANKDGEVSDEERRAFFQAEGERRRQEFMSRFDRNGNGEIDEDEREAIRQDFALRRFDRDGDGQLNAEERAAADEARARDEERRAQFMERFDRNGNGEIDEDERAAIREEFGNRGRGGRGDGNRGDGNRGDGNRGDGGRGQGGDNGPNRGEL